ncbi:MAG: hypothetical protein RBS73_01480 [Prolixibacteraceae bacterium]|jgi:hypothetical protein|nr:hypothetical protein [Prolixibacteraceae bacterium]
MKQGILIVLLTVIFADLGTAQTSKIKATASIDSTRILIGDQVKLRLEVDQPKNAKLDFPEIGDSITSAIEVIERSPLDTFTLSDAEQIKIIQNFTITSFDTGVQMVPQFRFLLKHDGQTDSIFTQPLALEVLGMPLDTTKGPVDIKKPYAAPVTLKEVTPYILGIILIAAIIFFIFYYMERKKKNQPLFSRPEKPKEPAHIVALRELDRIKEEKIWQQDKIKQYYSELSDTLRIYIEGRFGIPAMEQTSDETLSAFRYRRDLIDEKSLEELSQILKLSDLVKFAKYYPLPDDNNLSLINAYFFVNQTKKEEIKKPEDPPVDDREGEEVEVK